MSLTMPSAMQIANLVEPLLRKNGVGVVVGVAMPGQSQLFFNFAGGFTAVDGSELTLDGDTIFAIASISKTFDATLYAWANLSSSATLGSYTPAGARPVGSNYAAITLLSLATYSSGLPQDNISPRFPPDQKQPYTVVEMFDYLATNPFPIEPQQGYAYSNLGFALLGAAVAVTAGSNGQDWASLLRSKITTPLGIDFTTLDVVSHSLLPQSYHSSGGPAGAKTIQFPAYIPAGGLVVSGNTFMTWLQYNMGLSSSAGLNPLLAQTLTPSGVQTPAKADLCLGWFYSPHANILSKDGAILGYNSLVSIVGTTEPGTDQSPAGVFIFINQRTKMLSKVMAGIFDIINDTTGSAAVETPELDAQES
ncbi:MAG TPA: serine hydrolase [Chthoniobacterales bacterium]|nr:serine hydrolase [Chthoniobacterales bacterium]